MLDPEVEAALAHQGGTYQRLESARARLRANHVISAIVGSLGVAEIVATRDVYSIIGGVALVGSVVVEVLTIHTAREARAVSDDSLATAQDAFRDSLEN